MTTWLAIGGLVGVTIVALLVILRLLVMVSDSELIDNDSELLDEDSELLQRDDQSELAVRSRS
jgi:hypothetical protein